MALLFMDTFDHYSWTDFLKKWTGELGSGGRTTNSNSDAAAKAFPGGGTVIVTNNTQTGIYKTWPGASTPATVIIGGWFYFTANPTTSDHFLTLMDGTTMQVGLAGDAAGHIIVTRGGSASTAGTTLATSTNTVALNTWNHIEVRFVVNNTTGEYEVRVNGTSTNWIAHATGANTRNTANNQATGLAFSCSVTGAVECKLIYGLDTTGSGPDTTFLGVCRGVALRPVAAGNYAQWTPNSGANWMAAADTYADGDLSFNGSATANQIDSFVFDDAPSGSGTIFAVQHVIEARQDAGAARTIASVQRSSATDYVGANQVLAAGYLFYLEVKSQNPDTGPANWTVAGLNAAEFGYKLIS